MTDPAPPPEDELGPAPQEQPWYNQPAFLVALAAVAVLIVVVVLARAPGDPVVTAPPGDPATETPAPEVTLDPTVEPDQPPAQTVAPAEPQTSDLPPEVETADSALPQPLSGSGDATATVRHAGGLAVLRAAHEGDGTFTVTLVDPDGATQALVDATGRYRGSRALGRFEGDYDLQVTADGAWNLSWEQPVYTAAPATPRLIEGRGDTATSPVSVEGGSVRVEWEHDGETDVLITVLTAEGEPVAEIGGPDGTDTVDLPGGLYVLDVVAEDIWRITIS
jgi:hypothetical protein